MSAKHIPKDSPHSFTAKVHVRERNVYRIMKQEKNTPVDHIANDNQHSNSDIDSTCGKKRKKNRKENSSSALHKFIKLLITVMMICAVVLVAFACGKEFIIDKEPEQSNMLPMGFSYEVEEESPWDRFIDFLFSGNSNDDQNDEPGEQNDDTDPFNNSDEIGLTDPEGKHESSADPEDTTSVKRKDEFYNFLILAKDKGGGNTDTIIVLSFDVENKAISLLQIPRDTCVNYNNGIRKINSVYSIGYRNSKGDSKEKTKKGIEALSNCLVQNFGIVIDKYVTVDLKGFRAIVDTIGGVDVYVQKDMVYKDEYQDLDINLKKGWNHLNGDKAEDFVRFRKGYVNADLGRMDAQKIFMSAFLKKLFNVSTVKKVPELMGHIMEYVDTNVTFQEATYFGTRLLDMNMSEITMHSLQGTAGSHTYYNGASYFSSYKNANIDLVNKYFNVFNKDLGPENVNPKMLVKESGSGKYEGGKTAEEIDENNPTLNYVY